jgi:hypothetical protein
MASPITSDIAAIGGATGAGILIVDKQRLEF